MLEVASCLREFAAIWAALASWTFIVIYGWFFKWWLTPMGEALWWRSFALSFLLTLNCVAMWVPGLITIHGTWYIYVSSMVYLFIAYTVTWLLWVLVRQTRADVRNYYGVPTKH